MSKTEKTKKKSSCKVEVYSRPCGFFRPVQVYNPGKQEEFKERKKYNINKPKE